MSSIDTNIGATYFELAKTDIGGQNTTLYVKIDKKTQITQFCITSPDLRWLARITMLGDKTCIKQLQDTVGEDAQLELVKMEVWGAKYAFLSQKMAYFGTSTGSVLCHGYCHTGTESVSWKL